MSYEERREAAVESVKAKRGFRTHVVAYLAVNALLVLIWTLSGGAEMQRSAPTGTDN